MIHAIKYSRDIESILYVEEKKGGMTDGKIQLYYLSYTFKRAFLFK